MNNYSISKILVYTVIAFWLAMSVLGPTLAPFSVGEIVSYEVFEGIGTTHILGTDYLGRDVLSRVLHASRLTIWLALFATLFAGLMGTSLGVLASLSPTFQDELISRIMDALISIPSKIFALVTIAAFGSSMPALIIIIGISYTPGCYRIVRSLAGNVSKLEFVTIAKARGENLWYLATREVLPNIVYPILADLGLRFVFVVLLLSSLSFLGLGVQPPDADLGSLVRENMSGLAEAAPAIIAPAVSIATMTIAVNLLIDILRAENVKG
ncbi:binding-protein-dependent transport systems inner membrane component [Aequoribacter fuscus]|uniref:Binding-protein-dependent transport systems inner membrane component n=1 Tax=Aequoribacter fuscus TaxID=2518989 RepID=F3L4X7_9GAMM|nr:ABC transporter permease [Aequoribacter fuscus]EGG28618.1 binding-protein-dependent transport systems inner membrane component [Aequoribacter fuscus]QHJ87381.1 ABC transporter permease [Aequoribacter fuscus]